MNEFKSDPNLSELAKQHAICFKPFIQNAHSDEVVLSLAKTFDRLIKDSSERLYKALDRVITIAQVQHDGFISESHFQEAMKEAKEAMLQANPEFKINGHE